MQYEGLADWKYRVTKAFTIQTDIKPTETLRTNFTTLTARGRLYIHKGFCWDGASGAFDTKNIMRGSCVHDAFCNLHQKGLIDNDQRKQADKLLYKLIKQDGMSSIRAKIVYEAVRKFVEIRY